MKAKHELTSAEGSAYSGPAAKVFSLFFQGLACVAILSLSASVHASNPIVTENALPGNPSTQWDISGAGDSTIQGFATDISVNQGGTIHFKIQSTASAYQIKIYRLGYYQGNGARLVATVTPSVGFPQNQPAPITDSSTGLIDYGNWAESASWQVPTNATSGVYIARLIRNDNGGASHIAFIVRNDSSTSDVFFQTSDTTWQAYNDYGGNSFYVGTGPGGGLAALGRAYKISFNRPFNTRGDSTHDWLFNAEYPMIRWLEANGYDVSYTTGTDTDRRGNLLLQHKLFLSVGHDEYWSATQRTNVETARAAGMNMAFFSANEVFWKTRWESSIDGSGTPYRTLVCYKETHEGAKIDPTPTWTGTWRDPRFSPPADGGRPENTLLGTLFTVNGDRTDSLQVPGSYGKLRFWRNTSVASLTSNATNTYAAGTLGYEWDETPDNGRLPAGLIRLSSTTVGASSGLQVLQDYGSLFAASPATHHLTLYRDPSGALIFGSGTVQWSWGLDSNHDLGSAPASPDLQQATVNLFADMGVQPASLQAGLTAASKSTDTTPPTSTIQSPASNSTFSFGAQVVISGTASDVGGRVAGVDVSTDGGTSWHPATGTTNWTYSWTILQAGTLTIKSRATDDSCNMETPGSGINVTVNSTVGTIWPNTLTPGTADAGSDPSGPVELGVRFRSDVAGSITGIRFYKASANTGTHVGNLWAADGTLLRSVTFTGESGSGWQQANFSTPVAIAANAPYVASYHNLNGHYSDDDLYFRANGVDNPPLHALADGTLGGNGPYTYSATSVLPVHITLSANYWVDVAFSTNTGGLFITTTSLPSGMVNAAYSTTLAALGGTVPYTWSITGGSLPSGLALNTNSGAITGTPNNAGTFNFTVRVSDASSPTTNATSALSIIISPAVPSLIIGNTNNGTSLDNIWDTQSYINAGRFQAPSNMTVSVIRAEVGAISGHYKCAIYSDSSALPNLLLGSTAEVGNPGAGWQSFPLTSSVALTSGSFYWLAIWSDDPAAMVYYSSTTGGTLSWGQYNYGAWPNPITTIGGSTYDYCIYAYAANNGPTLSAGTNQTVNELTLLTVTNTAIDTDIPTLPLTYSLVVTNILNNSIVLNAAISTNGVITWTPTEAQGPGTNRFTTVVSDGSLSATNSFIVVVNEVNVAPVLPVQGNATLIGLQSLTVTNTASDSDIPVNPLGYRLASAPTGASIDTNGIIRWTPVVGQVPGVYPFTTIVTDTNVYAVNAQSLSATNTFTVTVQAIHNGPTLSAGTNQTVNELTLLTVTNMAIDTDIPALPLTYSLMVSNVLDGSVVVNAAISTNGVISWTPTEAQGPGTNRFTTVVSDGSLSATNSFIVVVNEVNVAPTLPVQSNATLIG
ncbi:MAG: N,N-dimethylformamidase beta subunit family domain-containing protein, partial [Verrucomicrobiia bacterium]